MVWQTILKVGAEDGCILLMGHETKHGAWRFRIEKYAVADKDIISNVDGEIVGVFTYSPIVDGFENAVVLLDEQQSDWADLFPLEVDLEFWELMDPLVRKRCLNSSLLIEWHRVLWGEKQIWIFDN